jgi:hypothetical protein
VFDDTLKQGLRVQLEQSPFLNVVSDQKVNEELQLMGRQKNDRLTPTWPVRFASGWAARRFWPDRFPD